MLKQKDLKDYLVIALYLFLLLSFATLSFIEDNHHLTTGLIGFALAVFIIAVLALKFGLTPLIRATTSLFALVLSGYLVLDGGYNNTGYLWIYPILLATVQIQGLRWGGSVGLLILVMIGAIDTQIGLSYELPNRFYYTAATLTVASLYIYLLESYRQRIDELLEQKETLSYLDPLTQVGNRRFANQELRRLNQADKHRSGLLLIDVDNFKSINDSYGHRMGDAVLLEVSKQIQSCLHPNDAIARWGGDEFIVFLHDISKNEFQTIAKRIVKRAQQIELNQVRNVTLSIGGAMGCDRHQILFEEADQKLMEVKKKGKNHHLISA